MDSKKNIIFLMIVSVITILVGYNIIKTYRRTHCIHQNEINLIRIGQAFKSYIRMYNRLPLATYYEGSSWSNVLMEEGCVKDPSVFLSSELKLIKNKDEFRGNDLSYVYNRGFEIAGDDENIDGLNYNNITSPANTILLVECFWAGNWEQTADSENQITSVKDARQISGITKKILEYKAELGYLVLFADGHIERFKAAISPSDQRLKYIKERVDSCKGVVLCKKVIDDIPTGLTETYKSGEMINVFIEWNERNYNKISFEIYSHGGVLMGKRNMINRNHLASWAFFSTEDNKWRQGEYLVKIYVNGNLQIEKIFNIVK